MINNHPYYYYQYREGKKVISRIIKDDELISLRKSVNERKKLIKLNKLAKNEISKNIRVIAIFDKGLSASLEDESFAFSFDEIPPKDRDKISLPFVNVSGPNSNLAPRLNIHDYFKKWQNGEIRAREISNYIIQKISD